MFHFPYSTFSAFYSHHSSFLGLYIRSLETTYLPPSHRLLFPMPPRRIVLSIFGYCPRAGLFAAATLCRFWNSVATIAWLGFALAAFRAFYAVFASPSQDKLSGL